MLLTGNRKKLKNRFTIQAFIQLKAENEKLRNTHIEVKNTNDIFDKAMKSYVEDYIKRYNSIINT